MFGLRQFLFLVGLAASIPSGLLSAEPSSVPGMIQSEFIFAKAPFASCHASTIVESRGGVLVTAWFGGSAEGHSDVKIWLARRGKEGWTVPLEVARGTGPDGEPLPCWNPVLFQPGTGPLMLFYKVGASPKTWWGMWTTSDDDGQTWSQRSPNMEYLETAFSARSRTSQSN